MFVQITDSHQPSSTRPLENPARTSTNDRLPPPSSTPGNGEVEEARASEPAQWKPRPQQQQPVSGPEVVEETR